MMWGFLLFVAFLLVVASEGGRDLLASFAIVAFGLILFAGAGLLVVAVIEWAWRVVLG